MCFYYSIKTLEARELARYGVKDAGQLSMFGQKAFVNGFRYPLMPVIRSDRPESIEPARWGMVPPNTRSHKDAESFLNRYNTLNARGEGIHSSRMYAQAIRHRRCLVPCSGFYEWRHGKVKGKTEKYPFYVSLRGQDVFVFGGVWNEYTDQGTGEQISTYAIITTPANELMETVHNSKKRMPLIIEPEKAAQWLGPQTGQDEICALIRPLPADAMQARPIAKINPRMQSEQDDGDITAYYPYPELQDLLDDDMFEQGGMH